MYTITQSHDRSIEVPDKSKNVLFVLANLWLVDNFESAKSVIQYSDKEAGVIAGKGNLVYAYSPAYYVSKPSITTPVGIKFFISDEKVKVFFTPSATVYGGAKKELDAQLERLLQSLTEYLSGKTELTYN
jgi:hypothetical protein